MITTVDLVNKALRHSNVRGDIISCTRCPRHHKGPVPFSGPAPSPFMLLGDAPSALDDRVGKPFVGNMGKELTVWFVDARLPPLNQWFAANVVSCRPAGEKIDPAAITNCASHLRAQLELCDPRWVLLLGAVALGAVGLKGKLGDVHGRVIDVPYGPFKGRRVLATYHPRAGFHDPKKTATMQNDLAVLAGLINGGLPVSEFIVKVGRNGKVG